MMRQEWVVGGCVIVLVKNYNRVKTAKGWWVGASQRLSKNAKEFKEIYRIFVCDVISAPVFPQRDFQKSHQATRIWHQGHQATRT